MLFVYRGAKTSQIGFPLGGIGTGCIGLAGNGRLVDWEIFNRPSKGSANGFSTSRFVRNDPARSSRRASCTEICPRPIRETSSCATSAALGSGPCLFSIFVLADSPVRLPSRSPNLNAYAERFVRSIKSEYVAQVIPLGERHLRRVIGEYVEHYHVERNHQGPGNGLIEYRADG